MFTLIDIFVNVGKASETASTPDMLTKYISLAASAWAVIGGCLGFFVWKNREKYSFDMNRLAAIKDKMVDEIIRTYGKLFMLLSKIEEPVANMYMFINRPDLFRKNQANIELLKSQIDNLYSMNKEVKEIMENLGYCIESRILQHLVVFTANIDSHTIYLKVNFDSIGNLKKDLHQMLVKENEWCGNEVEIIKNQIKKELGFKELKTSAYVKIKNYFFRLKLKREKKKSEITNKQKISPEA